MWLTIHRLLRALSRTPHRNTTRHPHARTFRPRLEALEERMVLSPYVVTTTADSGPGSLRDAINAVNADTSHALYASPTNPNVDEIDFNIPTTDPGYNSTTGAYTIQPLSALPTITNSVIIDGYTQAGASANTLAQGDNAVLKIDLDGSQAGADAVGLDIIAQSVVRGLDVTNWGGYGIWLDENGSGGSSNSTIAGNFLGTDVTGQIAMPNGGGLQVQYNSHNAALEVNSGDNLIGGTDPASRNLVSGNASYGVCIKDTELVGNVNGNEVQGNLIGTDATGTKALGNGTAGVLVEYAGPNTIGGTTTGARNVISGNMDGGIRVGANGTVIEGNYIGTDVTGTKALGNATNGVGISFASNTTVGGTLPGAGNVISANPYGVQIGNSTNTVVQGNLVGTDASGSEALGNGGAGVFLQYDDPGTLIGGTAAGAGNVISGSTSGGRSSGIFLGDSTDSHPVIEGNLIGTDITGTKPLGNNLGIYATSTDNNTIGGTPAGAGNTIAFNGDGVAVYSGTGNAILGNSIHDNSGLGIYLDSATNANDNQAAPVLTSANSSSSGTTLSGTLTSTPNTTFRIEFFANAAADPSGYGEGQTLLGSVNVITDANGNATFTTTLPALPAGQTVLSATATNLTTNDTSQFSNDVSVPRVGAITAPLAPVAVNSTINTSASFTDASTSGTDTAVWNWGDGTTSNGTVTQSNGAGTVSGSHAYTTDGVYTVTLTVTNGQGGSGQSVYNYVVVYNPSGGFTTGGGWFNSPAGADAANATLTGKATFGFNVKYPSNSAVPTGQLEFQFPAANLDFQSTSYDWLVLNGNQAQFQGSGTINGTGNYGFLVTVVDNSASGGTDALRIEIWDKNNNNAIVYDSQSGAATTALPTTSLGGGNIQIHANH